MVSEPDIRPYELRYELIGYNGPIRLNLQLQVYRKIPDVFILTRLESSLSKVRFTAIVAAGFWGLFWIPLRALEDQGISGAWATVLFYIVPFLMMIPFAIKRWEKIRQGGMTILIISFFLGLSITLYTTAYLFTDVVRVLLLYYMLPVWGTILGRVMLGETITRPRIVAIVLGFMGLLVIFGIGDGIPWPRNIGDWMALSSGMIWALGSTLTKGDETCAPFDLTFYVLGWSTLSALALLLIPQVGALSTPHIQDAIDVLPWMIPVCIFLVFPVSITIVWASSLLSPGQLGILFMSEISIGVIGAALLTNEIFGVRELLGVLLITSAGLCEITIFSSGKQSGKQNDP